MTTHQTVKKAAGHSVTRGERDTLDLCVNGLPFRQLELVPRTLRDAGQESRALAVQAERQHHRNLMIANWRLRKDSRRKGVEYGRGSGQIECQANISRNDTHTTTLTGLSDG